MFKESEEVAPSHVVSQSNEVLEEAVNDPFQREKVIASELDGETCIPSSPKTTIETPELKDTMTEDVRKDEEEVDENYVFKLVDHYVCKPMEKGLKM